ncbi:MAG: reverse transcriptase-like protein [Chloroflexota bacterium]
MVLLQFDGMLKLLKEQPEMGGLLGYGWIISSNGSEIAHGFGLFANKQTVNSSQAEYLALIEGLDALVDLYSRNEHVEIIGDAKCVIDQMSGTAAISSLITRKLHERACKLAGQFSQLTWAWVPRSKNKRADKLSRRGLLNLYNSPGSYESVLSQLDAHPGNQKGFISMLDLRVYSQRPMEPLISKRL